MRARVVFAHALVHHDGDPESPACSAGPFAAHRDATRGRGFAIDAGGDDNLLGLPPGYVRERALEHKLIVLRGFRSMSQDGFLAFARAFDPAGVRLHEWPQGPVMDVKIDPQAVNYLFTNERVPLHVDGLYDGEPSYLVFQCVQAPRQGGATLFVDAAKVWDLADDEHRRIWERT